MPGEKVAHNYALTGTCSCCLKILNKNKVKFSQERISGMCLRGGLAHKYLRSSVVAPASADRMPGLFLEASQLPSGITITITCWSCTKSNTGEAHSCWEKVPSKGTWVTVMRTEEGLPAVFNHGTAKNEGQRRV